MSNRALVALLVALFTLGGVVVPHILMHYEVKSGAIYLGVVVVLGLIMGHYLTRWAVHSKQQAEQRAHINSSSRYSDQ